MTLSTHSLHTRKEFPSVSLPTQSEPVLDIDDQVSGERVAVGHARGYLIQCPIGTEA